MTRKDTIPMTKVLLAAGLVMGILATAACTKEVIKEVPVPGTPTIIREVVPGTPTVIREVVPGTPTVIREEVIKEVPVPGTPTVIREEVTKEVPMALSALAQAIRDGKIDVGKGYGLAFGDRYHTIHGTTLELECAACHIVGTLNTTQAVFNAQDVSPQAPGPVDRRACLGCHGVGGPATELYGSGGS